MAQVARIVKTAVITGGAGGLGRALSAKLLDWGWRIYLLDIDVSGVETTDRLYAIQVDLTKDDQLITASEKVLNVSPALDLVIYNAGVSHIAYFGEATDAAHRRMFEINYFPQSLWPAHFRAPLGRRKERIWPFHLLPASRLCIAELPTLHPSMRCRVSLPA